MKTLGKAGYIGSILFGLFAAWTFFPNDASAGNSTMLSLMLILSGGVIVGAVAKLMGKGWGKFVTIGSLTALALLNLSNPFGLVFVIISVVLIALALLFS